jgi:hypothetical protein
VPNVGRGATRVWVVLLTLFELIVLGYATQIVWIWARENPFDQFDKGYEPLWARLSPLAVAAVVIAAAGVASWFVVRWIARGFSN